MHKAVVLTNISKNSLCALNNNNNHNHNKKEKKGIKEKAFSSLISGSGCSNVPVLYGGVSVYHFFFNKGVDEQTDEEGTKESQSSPNPGCTSQLNK